MITQVKDARGSDKGGGRKEEQKWMNVDLFCN